MPDPRMLLTLKDMERFYSPPQVKRTAFEIIDKRHHKTQKETEADEAKQKEGVVK